MVGQVSGAVSPQENSLLIVDDDKAFSGRLSRAMEGRGFEVRVASTVEEGLALIRAAPPNYAVVDMRLEDGSGLDVIALVKALKPEARAIVLTGYGNIATAVTAVKLGAVDYLAKPADADDICAALLAPPNQKPQPPEIRCPPTASAGSTFNASMSCATATSRRRRGGSICIAGLCSASSPSAPRNRPAAPSYCGGPYPPPVGVAIVTASPASSTV